MFECTNEWLRSGWMKGKKRKKGKKWKKEGKRQFTLYQEIVEGVADLPSF